MAHGKGGATLADRPRYLYEQGGTLHVGTRYGHYG